MRTPKAHPAPLPLSPRSGGQPTPPGSAKSRTLVLNGSDGMTGPSYSNRRGNKPVSGATGNVRRFGVMAGSRREWDR